MSNKIYYDEDSNEMRSRPEKSLYKKVSFWLLVVFSVTVGAVDMYILTNNDEVVDEIKKEDVNKEAEQIEAPKVEEERVQEEAYTY